MISGSLRGKSDRPLVPLQQIGFGGQDTLRGYRQDLLLGDNGAALSAELRIPV
ncbi:MAG: ShlB/FhaC/HecB family hemolysin secretion/activation protein [Pseudanabaena sp.]